MAAAQTGRGKKKGSGAAGQESAGAAGAAAVGTRPRETADGGDRARQLRFQVLAAAGSHTGAAPIARISAKELRAAGLEAGDLLVLRAESGRQTVATCDANAGASMGATVLAPSVLLSLGVHVGDWVTATADFEATEAGIVDLEVPAELDNAWPDVAGALQMDRYIKAAFEGSLLVAGDVRFLSLGGRPWQLRVLRCTAACPGRDKAKDAARGREEGADGVVAGHVDQEQGEGAAQGPCLVVKGTRMKLVLATTVSRASGPMEAGAPPEPRGFARVGGLRSVVEELVEAVQMPLTRPDLYRRLGVRAPRGVLLYGPPGTGKTLLARSLAEELRCPVELVAATDLVGTGIGESEDRIVATFARCREQAKQHGAGALLFIDEIDAVCPKREDSGEAERRMVAAFLTALDGASGDDGVVVLGATNRPDAIDPAMRRAGRLEREIEVGVPNADERGMILKVHLASLRHALSAEEVSELARRCHGYVGADLRALCMTAARAALRTGEDAVTLQSCVAAMRSVPPSALKELLVEVPHVRWEDIGGYDATKEALKEAVEWPIVHAWAFEALAVDPPRGVLLYGPPGCSKTMMAKAVATETEMNFISIKGPELFSKYVGDSERAVRDVFRKARAAAPCVVFFDEVDAVGATREGDGAGGVAARVLAQLLAEMDGVSAAGPRRHVVVLAATNRPHALDPALLRPGRFDRLVHVPLPDEVAREAIFRNELRRMQVSEEVDPAVLAGRTAGYTGAEAVMVCREAALLAIREAVEGAGGGALAAGESALRVRPEHLDRALSAVRPRIDAAAAQFYVDFERRMQDA